MAKSKGVWGRITGTIASIPKRLAGEMSKLRKSIIGGRARSGRYSKVYQLDSSRVDYELARELYDNSRDEYKLGGWCFKPIINTAVGFMGVPRFRSEDQDAQEALEDFFDGTISLMQQTHRDALRDGDSWVWITREEDEDEELYPETNGVRLVYNLIPPEQIDEIIRSPFTGRPIEYVLKSKHEWTDEAGTKRKGIVTQRISAERRLIEVDGDTPPGVEPGETPNRWGFIPIVQFSNEKDSSAANGKSDLEPVEPFAKAYHDIMLQAIQGNKLHSTPKLKLKLKSVANFLRNNFGIEDPAKFVQEGGEISLDGQEIIFLEAEDDAGFAEVQSATGSAQPLLELLFYCIIDVSETPEFAFGASMSASHASVKEQMPVLIRRVARKRSHFEESWQRLARIVLTMTSMSSGKRFSTHATTLIWDPIQERDEKQAADTIVSLVNALSVAVRDNLMGQESAVNLLAQYVETMSEWAGDDPEQPGEREKIIRTKLMLARLDDAELADKEIDEIEAMLKRLGVGAA